MCLTLPPLQLNIASSVPGSRMSLNVSSEEDDEDNFTAAISIVTGTPLKDKSRTKKKPLDLSESLGYTEANHVTGGVVM